MEWAQVARQGTIRLNFGGGGDCHPHPLYQHYISVDANPVGEWSVRHDLTTPIPLPDGSVDRILSEHFLEHLPREAIPGVLSECYRLLKPGGIARHAVPDYHGPKKRSALRKGFDHRHSDHLTLPHYPMMRDMVEKSPFRKGRFYQYWDGDEFVHGTIDYSLGYVKRTVDNDYRNFCVGARRHVIRAIRDAWFVLSHGFMVTRNDLLSQRYHPLRGTSIVVDLQKPG